MISFGKKHRGKTIEQVAEIDPAYIGFLMYGTEWFRSTNLYKKMLAQGYDKYSPYVYLGEYRNMSIATVRALDPDYYNWIVRNKNIRSKYTAVDRWINENSIASTDIQSLGYKKKEDDQEPPLYAVYGDDLLA